MSEIWFTCRAVCSPATRADWDEYVAWANLPQLREVLSLDGMLCPDVIGDLETQDWDYNVHEDYHIFFFRDFEYLRARVQHLAGAKNFFAVCLNPETDARALFDDARFEFAGYDLMDEWAGNSALTNCGGFPNAFANEELSELGLLQEYARACVAREQLLVQYPDEPHADCDVWALWKYRDT